MPSVHLRETTSRTGTPTVADAASRSSAPRNLLRHIPTLIAVIMLFGSGSAQAVFGDKENQDVDLPLREIVIEGNTRTDANLILREMDLQIGQPFSFEDMDAIWDRLEDIGYFAFVDMEYDDSASDGVILRVTVEEDMTTSYGPLVRYDRRFKYKLGGWLEESNLRGKGESLRIALSVYYIQQGSISWTRPWFLGQRGLEAKLAFDAKQANFVFRPTKYRQWDGDFTLRWDFWNDFFVEGGLNYGQDRYRDSYYWALPDRGPDSPTGSVLFEPTTDSRFAYSASIGFDSRPNPWYPSHGLLAQVTAKRWQSDDFASYTETSADVRAFIPLPWDHILAARAWGRRTDGPTHLDNVLFFGGPQTIRGYQFGGLEGEEGYLLTAEYRIPLFLMPISPSGEMVGFGLHAFADAGDTWYYGADPGTALQSWGAGLHINLDRQQFRFEGAQNLDGDWTFEFMDVMAF